MNFKEIRSEGVDWINVTQDRDTWQTVENRVMTLSVPSMWKIFFYYLRNSFSRRTLFCGVSQLVGELIHTYEVRPTHKY